VIDGAGITRAGLTGWSPACRGRRHRSAAGRVAYPGVVPRLVGWGVAEFPRSGRSVTGTQNTECCAIAYVTWPGVLRNIEYVPDGKRQVVIAGDRTCSAHESGKATGRLV